MSIDLIQERLNSYKCQSVQEEENAIREIAQEIVLGGLSRTGFFKYAAFQGGTCLRMIYGLERFSEDLDFVLVERDKNFDLNHYLEGLNLELKAYGFDFNLKDRKDVQETVQKQFVKDDSLVKLIHFKHFKPGKDTKSIRIKIEIDTNPPAGSKFETKYHDFPFVYEVALQDMPSLFASKNHALLCRVYVKGRDWYDFIWYVSRKSQINFKLLRAAIDQQGPWKGRGLGADRKWYLTEMEKRIKQINFDEARNDVKRFIRPNELASLEFWNTGFFLDRLDKLSQHLKQ